MLALTLAGLLRRRRTPGGARADAVLAAQPALVYSFALQGSIKELATLWLVPLLVALGASTRRMPASGACRQRRTGLALRDAAAVSSAASVAVGAAVLARPGPARRAGAGGAPGLASASPRRAGRSLRGGLGGHVAPDSPRSGELPGGRRKEVLTSQQELGNLLQPLDALQVFGIWLAGDYRVRPGGRDHGLRTWDLTVHPDRRGAVRRDPRLRPCTCAVARPGPCSTSAPRCSGSVRRGAHGVAVGGRQGAGHRLARGPDMALLGGRGAGAGAAARLTAVLGRSGPGGRRDRLQREGLPRGEQRPT